MNWPNPLSGSSPFGSWMNSLLRKAQSCELKSGVGYRVKTTSSGTTLEILGKSGSGDSWPPTIYSISNDYSVGDWVWVQATDTITTTGATYPPTGLTAMSKSGLWRCVKSAPAGYFPVAPYPSPDDPTASNMYWLYFGNMLCV